MKCNIRNAIALTIIVAAFLLMFTSCSANLTDKNDIVRLFQKHEQSFLKAASSGEFGSLERIIGIHKVYVSDKYVDIKCGGSGFGPSTHYYGIFYSEDDNLCAVDVSGPKDKLVENGNGYLYQEYGGDNSYYVEPLGNHFFYYEAHF